MKGQPRTEEEALVFLKPMFPFLQRGMSIKQAAIMARLPQRSAYDYYNKFPKVRSEIDYNMNILIATASDTVAKAAATDPKIALEALKRRSKEQWGDNVDVTTGGQPVNLIDFTNARTNTKTDTDNPSD